MGSIGGDESLPDDGIVDSTPHEPELAEYFDDDLTISTLGTANTAKTGQSAASTSSSSRATVNRSGVSNNSPPATQGKNVDNVETASGTTGAMVS